ncbi:hypothetical protein MJT46_009419 [Ovis ammon polii x Ovis aries]|nr:hypothetical protein MJT46_009419 [Ovis ammon polii x Ovis aries]
MTGANARAERSPPLPSVLQWKPVSSARSGCRAFPGVARRVCSYNKDLAEAPVIMEMLKGEYEAKCDAQNLTRQAISSYILSEERSNQCWKLAVTFRMSNYNEETVLSMDIENWNVINSNGILPKRKLRPRKIDSRVLEPIMKGG